MALTRPRASQIISTTIDFSDPLIVINKDQTGNNDKDIGFVFERGTDTNVAIVWDESVDRFAFINTTETGTTSGNVSISSYSNLTIGSLISSGLTYPSSDGTNGQALITNGSGTLSFSTITAGAAGSNTQVQYNNNGSLGASANLTFNGTTLTSTGFSGPLTGNADTATKWATARTITLGGVLSGNVSIDGSSNVTLTAAHTSDPVITLTGDVTGSATMTDLGNVSITATVVDDSHNHIISNVDGLQTALDGKAALSGATFTGDISGTNLTLSGNLTVSGTTTYVNTTTLNIGDNIITLNADETGTPSQNAGIEIERGTSTNVILQWNETSDHWEIATGGTTGRILTTGDEGSGNGLDADTLDGIQAASFLRSDANDDFAGTLNYTPDTGDVVQFDGGVFIKRLTANGGARIGKDDCLVLGGGEAVGAIETNITTSSELVHIGAESGIRFYSFPSNDTTWANRKEMIYDDSGNLTVPGQLNATTKSFLIDHPTKPDMKLRYGSLEGPENGVYVRGRLTNSNTIELPDYWIGLVDKDSITVNLTPIGRKNVWVENIENNIIKVGCDEIIDCFYTVFAERKDVDKLIVEYSNEN